MPPLEVDQHTEYEVDFIRAVTLKRKRLWYKIQWKGWDEDPDWYPASALINSPVVIQDFYIANPRQPGPPIRLQHWLRYAQKDQFALPYKDDGIPATSRPVSA